MNGSKKKFFLNLGVAIALTGALSVFGMDYFIKEIEESSAKIIEDKKKINMLKDKNEQLAESKKRYEEVEKGLELVLQSVVDEDKTVDFIKEVEKTAADNKVRLKIQTSGSKDAQTAPQDSFISESDFVITTGGSFEGVMSFLYALENFKYEADISEVKMSFGDFDEYNKDLIVLTFKLKSYQKVSQK